MNVKKVITVALAVFVLCAVFCGAVSAMNVQTGSLVVNPSGSLVSGDTISATVNVEIPEGTYNDSSYLNLSSNLDAADWSVVVRRGGVDATTISNTGKSVTITSFDIKYPESIILRISVNGIVSSGSAGQNITVMKIDSYERAGLSTWSTPAQFVYNSANLSGELAVLESDINALQARIDAYAGYGWDVSEAQSLLNTAKSQLRDAQSAGTADVKTAYSKIEAARTSLKNATMKLALASLSLSLSYTGYIDDIIDLLYAKGWNSEAMLLDTKNSNLKNIYNQQLTVYNAGNLPDAVTIDTLAVDSINLYNDAQVYKESSDHPFAKIMDFLPFILIGLGAIAIIVVVIVVIIKKRKNSWDELG